MTINVVGLGYIGLPTALMFASAGIHVVGSDKNLSKVEALSQGQCVFEETGMTQLYQAALQKGIEFQTETHQADIYIIAVPTPYQKQSKKIELSYVEDAVLDILSNCQAGAILVVESTIAPGTIDHLKTLACQKGWKPGENIHFAHAPERVIPGNIIHELANNSRTIGVESEAIGEIVKKIYSMFCSGEIVLTSIRIAEMSKLVENTYRDVNIAYANELAKICHMEGLDVHEIIRIANKHPRVNVLSPGPGVGGHCIAVDPWFLVGEHPGLANIILAARKINDSMPAYVIKRMRSIADKHAIHADRIGLYGLTYKENVNDIRDSPTIQLLECMRYHFMDGFKVYDPYVKEDVVPYQYHQLDEFLDAVSFIVLMVGHDEIVSHMDQLSSKIILDTRNICTIPGAYRI